MDYIITEEKVQKLFEQTQDKKLLEYSKEFIGIDAANPPKELIGKFKFMWVYHYFRPRPSTPIKPTTEYLLTHLPPETAKLYKAKLQLQGSI